ncbi:acyltransferase family protein [Brackiella oedipodis]|uniref:acyltransferase family protein n=1 Tax=Brackiella oedipodis TaxID=124225 RepID=UPI00048A6EB4|nr:acyltransferase family protein [Brackiella oedipodis]
MDLIAQAKNLHPHKVYRADIDGLRAIAVLLVIMTHAFPKVLPAGFIGVDIFFVISGYLITAILLKDNQNGRYRLTTFYKRRIRRLFPALIVAMGLMVALGWYVLYTPEFQRLGKHIAASALFIENFALWQEVGYFDVAAHFKPSLHLWSLAIEEQFYIVWPVLLWLGFKKHWSLWTLFALLWLLSFAYSVYLLQSDLSAAYYHPLSRAWELLSGASLALLQFKYQWRIERFNNSCVAIALALIIVSSLLIDSQHFPGVWALLPVLATLLLLSAGHQGRLARWCLCNRFMVWCGLISYPLYLFHWPLLSYARIAFSHPSYLTLIICILLAFALAHLVFSYLERPLRTSSTHSVPWLVSGLVMALSLGLLMWQGAWSPRLNKFQSPAKNEWSFFKEHFKRTCDGVYELAPERAQTILFLGDSHAAQYAPRLYQQLQSDADLPGVTMVLSCGALPVQTVLDAQTQRPRPIIQKAYEMAQQAQYQKVVIAGAINIFFDMEDAYIQQAGQTIALNTDLGKTLVLQWLSDKITQLKKAGKQVYFVLDQPQDSGFEPASFKKINRFKLHNTDFNANSTLQIEAKEIAAYVMTKQVIQNTGAILLDAFAQICSPDGRCQVTTDKGMPVYKDGSHLNPAWVKDHARFIDAIFN